MRLKFYWQQEYVINIRNKVSNFQNLLNSISNVGKQKDPFLTLQPALNSTVKYRHYSIPRNHITKPFHFQLNLPRNYNALTHMHVHYNTSLV